MKVTTDSNQIGIWEYGFCTDREIITKIINVLNHMPNRQYIHRLNIIRKPADPDDLSKGGLMGFTSIKVDYSEDPYKTMFP